MTNNILILYVEDNPENRLLIRRILGAEGFTVVEAENAAKALDFVASNTPDLILMDIQMPEIDGIEATRQIKQLELSHQPWIVAMTAYSMKEDEEKFLKMGLDDYLAKPIRAHKLIDKVKITAV